MELYVLNESNEVLDIVPTFKSCIWNVQYFGQNDFELTVDASKIAVLQPGNRLVRTDDVSNGVMKNVMAIQNFEMTFDSENGWLVKLTGKGLKNDILRRRIVWTQTNLTGTAENGIRQVITENVISPTDDERAIPNFTLETAKGYDETIDVQLFGENIAEWLETVCMTYGYGWDVYIDNGDYVFTLYKGTNRTYDQDVNPVVVFSPEFDNLLTSSYTYNLQQFRNAAMIGGEGEGTSQRKAYIGTAEGLDRYEAYVDGSGVSSNGEIITVETYTKMLQEYGQMEINKTDMNESFTGSIDYQHPFAINEDFFLGDLVQIENENGIKAAPRITEVIYSEDDTGYTVVPTFSEWEVQ